jgi:zinc D-Ala-D-Ala carboxypeptidase
MKLTENFTLQEMIHSNTAIAKGIVNMPNEQQINFIRELCINVLQPIREEFGVPIRISSGFRSPRLNVAIGGSTSSQHCALRGAAADIQMDEMNAEIFNYIKDELIFDQLIWEFGDGQNPDWVHVSFHKGNNRKQILKAVKQNGKTKYLLF